METLLSKIIAALMSFAILTGCGTANVEVPAETPVATPEVTSTPLPTVVPNVVPTPTPMSLT